MGGRRRITNAIARFPLQQYTLTIHGFGEGVDDAPQPTLVGIDQRVRVNKFNCTTKPNAFKRSKGRRKRAIIPKSDDFTHDVAIATSGDTAAITD